MSRLLALLLSLAALGVVAAPAAVGTIRSSGVRAAGPAGVTPARAVDARGETSGGHVSPSPSHQSRGDGLDEAGYDALVSAFSGDGGFRGAGAVVGGSEAAASPPVPFTLANCDPTAAIQVTEATIKPDPIPIGGEATGSASGTISRQVNAPIQTSVTLEKEFYGRWLPVPCLDVLGHRVGSCEYDDVCGGIDPGGFGGCPPPLGPAGIPCACPIPAGNYTLPPTTMATPVPKELPKELGNGNYRVSVKMKDALGPVACYDVEFSTVGV